ncbi:MAG TPA: hypothetical protein PLP29_06400 [Candidatus Ozemobacteraceae bacterium]|nr:hypothetical protein [Candidatus Ozemobacteraceae bacterium]
MNRWIAVLFLLPLGVSSVWAGDEGKPRFGVVDYMVLLDLHPLTRLYNPQTGRFEGTVSSPVTGGGAADLATRIGEIRRRMVELDAAAKPVLARGGEAASREYDVYWKRRKALQDELELAEAAERKAGLSGEYHEGMPTPDGVMDVCVRITATIDAVLSELQRRHGLTGIMNVRPLVPRIREEPAPPPLPNLHWKVWYGQPVEPWELTALANAGERLLGERFPDRARKPFKAGVIDLTMEAVRGMLEYRPVAGEVAEPPAAAGGRKRR